LVAIHSPAHSMKRMKRVRKCQGIFLVIIFKMCIPAVQKERWRSRFIRSSPATLLCSITGAL
jgi:hypothetical protein